MAKLYENSRMIDSLLQQMDRMYKKGLTNGFCFDNICERSRE